MARSLLLCLCMAVTFPAAWAESKGFLILSAPRSSRISYLKIPEDGNFTGASPRVLVDSGLQHPQGVAVDHKRKLLYVADPDVQKIYSYNLRVSEDGESISTIGQQMVVSQNAETRWVSVDGMGTLFFSDEAQNLILKLPAEQVLKGNRKPTVVYNGNVLSQVSRPGGVAVDNFHVFWTNKHFGTMEGSLVRGSELPLSSSSPVSLNVMSRNTAKSYGVCVAVNNVFYTDDKHNVYGMKKDGGKVTTITHSLKRPRGCVWDGDGTVFVADRGGNAVFSFAGDMHHMSDDVVVTKAFDFDDAFGLAFFSAAHQAWASCALLLVAALAGLQ